MARSPQVLRLVAEVAIEAANAEGVPTFTVRAYNGGALQIGNYPLPIAIDLAGMEFASSITVNLDHDPTQRVGHVTDTINSGEAVDLGGVVSAQSDAANEVVASSKSGYPWQASIEAQPSGQLEEIKAGKSVKLNNQTITGPAYIARQSKLYGFAFLSRGADEATSVTIAASAADKETIKMDAKLQKWLEAKDIDAESVTDEMLSIFEAQYQAEHKPAPKSKSLADILEASEADKKRQDAIAAIVAENVTATNVDALRILAEYAVEHGQTPQEFELAVLRASRPSGSFNIGATRKPKITGKVIEAAVAINGGLQDPDKHFDGPTLDAAAKEFKNGIGLSQVFVLAAQSKGFNANGGTQVTRDVMRAAFGDDPAVNAAGWSYIDISGILSNTANKFLTEGFNAVERVYPTVSSRRSTRDFKQISTYSLTADATYQKVGPGGELKHGSLGETPYTNQVETYGRMLSLTRQDLVNDDLGALTEVPRKLGRGAALSLNTVFWGVFLDNATFYAAGNNNLLAAGGVLDAAGLTAAENLFKQQTDPDGNPIGSMPRILLVPPSLQNTALALMNSMLVVGATDQPDTNVFQGRYNVQSSVYMENANLTGFSALAWYLLADPQDLSTIEIAYLNGQENPTVESADADFNTLGVQMRGFHDFGVAEQEFRGGVKSDGVA